MSDVRQEMYLIIVLRRLRTLLGRGTVPPSVVKSSALSEELHISRSATVRALNELERRGLITVDQRLARGTRVVSRVDELCICGGDTDDLHR